VVFLPGAQGVTLRASARIRFQQVSAPHAARGGAVSVSLNFSDLSPGGV
jgi:hypothetical protein